MEDLLMKVENLEFSLISSWLNFLGLHELEVLEVKIILKIFKNNFLRFFAIRENFRLIILIRLSKVTLIKLFFVLENHLHSPLNSKLFFKKSDFLIK